MCIDWSHSYPARPPWALLRSGKPMQYWTRTFHHVCITDSTHLQFNQLRGLTNIHRYTISSNFAPSCVYCCLMCSISSLASCTAISLGRSTALVQSTITGWISTKLWADIRGSLMKNPNGYGDPLTFLLEHPQAKLCPIRYFAKVVTLLTASAILCVYC